jgi:hypothetical protein
VPPETPLDAFPASSIQVHQDLWESSEVISDVFEWAFWASVWLVSLPIIFLVSLFFHQVQFWAYLDLFGGGALFVAGGVLTILKSFRARRVMERWESRMTPFFYAVKFDLLPMQGPSREEDIWKRYQSLFRSLASVGKPSWFPLSTSGKVEFNADVKGKKGKHRFNLRARADNGMLLLVRRFQLEAPVGRDDLQKLRDDAADVVRYEGPKNHVVAAFSASGFTPEAIEFAQSEESLVQDAWVDLVRETPTGYRVVSVPSD